MNLVKVRNYSGIVAAVLLVLFVIAKIIDAGGLETFLLVLFVVLAIEFLISIVVAGGQSDPLKMILIWPRSVPGKSSPFYGWLARMIERGYPLADSLDGLVDINLRNRNWIRRAAAMVREGKGLSESMDRYPRPPLLVREMVIAGEKHGVLGPALAASSEVLQRRPPWLMRFTPVGTFFYLLAVSAVVYLFTGAVRGAFFSTFVQMFADMQMPMPEAARFIWSNAGYFTLLFILFAALFVFYRRWNFFYGFLCRVPFLGKVLRLSLGWRSCLLAGRLVEAGVPFGDALVAVGRGLRQPNLCESGRRIGSKLDKGLSLAESVSGEDKIPAALKYAILGLGENEAPAGALLRAARFEREFEEIKGNSLAMWAHVGGLAFLAVLAVIMTVPLYVPLFAISMGINF